MEVVIVVVVVLLLFGIGIFAISSIGKAIGPPSPESLSDEALLKRRTTELDWLVKYSNLSRSKKEDSELKRMHDEKEEYLKLLTAEFTRRRNAASK